MNEFEEKIRRIKEKHNQELRKVAKQKKQHEEKTRKQIAIYFMKKVKEKNLELEELDDVKKIIDELFEPEKSDWEISFNELRDNANNTFLENKEYKKRYGELENNEVQPVNNDDDTLVL